MGNICRKQENIEFLFEAKENELAGRLDQNEGLN